MKNSNIPIPLLDSSKYLAKQLVPEHIVFPFLPQDFNSVKSFLLQFTGSTFEAYRRELERLSQWAWLIQKKSILKLKRADIESYIEFCIHPPKKWIGVKRVARFIVREGIRIPNPEWRLFVATIKKSDIQEGKKAETKNFKFSQESLSALFIAISSFYNHLLCENLTEANPVAQIRQKSKYLRRKQVQRKIRRLTERQWQFVIESAEIMAEESPKKHERTLFILSALYLMYLRISELITTSRWEPVMGSFSQDSHGSWWFKTVSKGNKERDITVSDSMLSALKRYRSSRDLSPTLPLPNDQTPLIHTLKGKGSMSSDRQIRSIIQGCFDRAKDRLKEHGHTNEAEGLQEATVHWLRHTGISDDINKRNRPVAHVRDDAGHSSSATTDRYNDIELQDRHASGKTKQLKKERLFGI